MRVRITSDRVPSGSNATGNGPECGSDRWVHVLLERISKHGDAGVGAWTEWVAVESQPCGRAAAAASAAIFK